MRCLDFFGFLTLDLSYSANFIALHHLAKQIFGAGSELQNGTVYLILKYCTWSILQRNVAKFTSLKSKPF